MSKRSHIRKSFYNEGKLELEHIVPNEFLLTNLKVTKNRLEKAIELLAKPPGLIDEEFVFKGNLLVQPNTQFKTHNNWQPGCQLSIDHLLDRYLIKNPSAIDRFGPAFISCADWCDTINIKPSERQNDRVSAINEELRILKLELKKKFSVKLFQQIQHLVKELHSIISFCFSEQKKHVKRLRVSLFRPLIRDIRKTLRQTFQIIFKNLPDFSGCEEEAEFTTTVNFKPLSLNKQKSYVQYKIFT